MYAFQFLDEIQENYQSQNVILIPKNLLRSQVFFHYSSQSSLKNTENWFQDFEWALVWVQKTGQFELELYVTTVRSVGFLQLLDLKWQCNLFRWRLIVYRPELQTGKCSGHKDTINTHVPHQTQDGPTSCHSGYTKESEPNGHLWPCSGIVQCQQSSLHYAKSG